MNIIVGVSDMKVSNEPNGALITYSLGSCIGIAIHDPIARVGGLLHFLLPESSLDPDKARINPFMFADTAIPRLFREAYQFGGVKERMKVIVVGGSEILDQKGVFNIGKRNYAAVQDIFRRNLVVVNHTEVGGNVNRTIRLDVKTGKTWLKVSGHGEKTL